MNPSRKQAIFSNIKKYFFDFLMLFLAVFLGFMADNYRDSKSEEASEKNYISSLIRDVESDRLELKEALKSNNWRKKYLDSLALNCFAFDPLKTNDFELYRLVPFILYHPNFLNPNEMTLQQLKNEGGKLIKNKKAIEQIYKYELCKQKLVKQQFYYETYQNKAIATATKLFTLQFFMAEDSSKQKENLARLKEAKLLSRENNAIQEFGNDAVMFRGIIHYYIVLLNDADKQADSLLVNLKKEYQIH